MNAACYIDLPTMSMSTVNAFAMNKVPCPGSDLHAYRGKPVYTKGQFNLLRLYGVNSKLQPFQQ